MLNIYTKNDGVPVVFYYYHFNVTIHDFLTGKPVRLLYPLFYAADILQCFKDHSAAASSGPPCSPSGVSSPCGSPLPEDGAAPVIYSARSSSLGVS